MVAQNCLFAVMAVIVAFCIAEGQSACHTCSGQACLRTSQVNVTKTCTSTDDMCASLFEGYVPIKKGCYSDLTAEEKVICDAVDNPAGYTCQGDRCNSLGRVDHKCKSCIATSSNSSCLFAPTTVADTRCTAPRTLDVYCSVNVVGNTTIRGCVSSNRDIVDCLNAPSMCSLCNVNAVGACNTFVFPANRRLCQYCTGDNCEFPNVTTTSAVARVCPKVDDRCVSINHNGVFHRLCAQEMTTELTEYCVAHNTSCTYCSTSGCNVASPPNPSGAGALALSMASLAALVVAVICATVMPE